MPGSGPFLGDGEGGGVSIVGDGEYQWTSNPGHVPGTASQMETQIPWSRGASLLLDIERKKEKGTHHSWNPNTPTGSLPSPRGTWGQQCGGTSLYAAGTESHRTCTLGGACKVASGSRCCFGGSLSGTCGQKKGGHQHPAVKSGPRGLHANLSLCMLTQAQRPVTVCSSEAQSPPQALFCWLESANALFSLLGPLASPRPAAHSLPLSKRGVP